MTKNKWIQDAIKHRGALRKTATKQGLIKGDEKLSMSDLNKLEKEGGKTAKQASLAKTLRSFADGGVIASNIIMQLGGFSRLQIMLGAYNFVDLKNGLSFKIKNARSNYIKITLNGKDLYDIEIGRIRGTTYKVIYKQEDVYAVDLKHIIENKTGMFMAFEDGGDVPMDMEILVISQVDKLANGGITALEVLEAREFVGEDDWKKMKPKERLSATRYLVKTGKIGYYEKSRKYADGVQLNKYKVKYLIGYSDDEDGLKYQEGKFYADSKDNVALEVFEHFKRLGYSHIEILGIILVADRGMEIKLTDEELSEKYFKIKGDLPNWFKDMPTRYKEEIIEEVEEELEEKKFANGGGIGSKRDNVINYYINNENDDILIEEFDVSEDYLKDRNLNYSKIFDIISDNLDDEDISYKFGELNLGEESEEPNYIEYGSGGFTSSFSGTPDRRRVTMDKGGVMYGEKINNWFEKPFNLRSIINRSPFHIELNNFDCAKNIKNKNSKVEIIKIVNPRLKQPITYILVIKNWASVDELKNILIECSSNIISYGFTSNEQIDSYRKMASSIMYNGGEIDWGADLDDGFSVGNDVYITDSKSLYKGKTGFVIGLVGKDLLVVILINGNEKSVVVNKKGVEKLDAPEFYNGGNVEQDMDDDDIDYNSISDLQSERNRLVRWENQYGKGVDYKIKQLEERIKFLKSKDGDYAEGGILPDGVTEDLKQFLIEYYYWDYLTDEIEVEKLKKKKGLEIEEKVANDWKVAKEVLDGDIVETSPYSTRYMYSPSLNKLREQTQSEWYQYGSVSDTFAKGGTILDLKDVYNELRSKVGRMSINEETKDYINCDIRDWGNWEHDYEDYERDEEDFEDDDAMILSTESYNRMKKIVDEVRAKYTDAKINWGTSEKNYIDFQISRKMTKGGKVKDPHPDYPDFVSMQYKKGGALKYYDKENEYKIGRPSGYIEKKILSRVDSKEEDFVGSFGWKTESKKLADGYLYKLSDFDKELVKDVRLKSGEKIFRYFNYNSAIGGMKPLIKINLDKELLYFLKDSNNIEFETRGVQAIWVALIEHKL